MPPGGIELALFFFFGLSDENTPDVSLLESKSAFLAGIAITYRGSWKACVYSCDDWYFSADCMIMRALSNEASFSPPIVVEAAVDKWRTRGFSPLLKLCTD